MSHKMNTLELTVWRQNFTKNLDLIALNILIEPLPAFHLLLPSSSKMPENRDDEEQRREEHRRAKLIIKELRQHQQQLEAEKDEAVNCRSQVLADHFKKAENNLTKASTADQALLDAQIFLRLGEYSKKQAAQLQMGLQTFDVKTFTDNLVVFMRGSSADGEVEEVSENPTLDFAKLGHSVWYCQRKVASVDFMLGNEPVENVTPVAERKKAKRVKKGAVAVKPDDLRSGEVQQTETDRQVAEMKRELAKRKQCNYWLFVIDPNSFSRSIENIFHSSFLVKDRLASIDFKVEPPMIRYIDPRETEEGRGQVREGPQKQSEFIMSFSHNMYLEMIRKHQIRQCILPPKRRQSSAEIYRQGQEVGGEGDEQATF